MSKHPRTRRFAVVGATLALTLTGLGGPATADTSTPVADEKASAAKGAIATYKGEQINLKKGWQGADICAEFSPGDIRCYDSEKQFNADADLSKEKAATTQAGICPAGWQCLFEHPDYGGRRLQWNQNGTYPLASYNFRDQASSFARQQIGCAMTLVNYRWHWNASTLLAGYSDPQLNSGPGGEDWGDVADEVRMSSC